MPDESDQPATKADISLLKAEMATKTELAAVKTELREDIARLDKKIDRVAVALVNTQADVRKIEQTMATKNDVERILDAIDAFATRDPGLGPAARCERSPSQVRVRLDKK